tara:strand:- start:1093 stop:2493 length:1401 start_codon:yes stop_codon:yes gene_type:complete
MRLTPKDKKVIQAFYEQTSAESKKLYTDGKVLDGLWMGGNAIAEWEGRKIKFNDLGSNASVTVQRAVKKYVPANYLKLSSTRRSASEIIRNLEGRVARLEKSAYKYNPNDMFEFEKDNAYIRFYLGGKYNTRTILEEIDSTFFKAMEYEFTYESGLPTGEYVVEECIAEAFDKTEIIEELSRTRKGERAIQVNLFKKDLFVKNVVKELEKNMADLERENIEYILDWSDEYEAEKAFKAGVGALTKKYGSVRTNRINPATYRLAATRKVAGHIVLAKSINVEKLRSALSETDGVEDIDFEDGVLSFLMDKSNNRNIEKEVSQLARSFKVKFEKGEFTDGLGMIYTKKATRRNRRASKPMFNLVLIKETLEYDENTSMTSDAEDKELLSKNIYSFEELLKELSNRIFYGWSWERNRVSYRGNKLSITSSYEYVTAYADERVVLHLNLARGVELDRAQIKMISKSLGMR